MSANARLRDLALTVAADALALGLDMRAQGVNVAHTKTSATDVVTAADQAVQQLIRDRLLQARPDDGFIGEEGGGREGTSGIRWVVDPIDGTVNYLYDISQWAVSIAAEDDSGVLAGAVASANGEIYSAARGLGATRDGQPIWVREPADMGHWLVHTGYNYQPEVRRLQAEYVCSLLPRVRDVRRMGSAALDIVMVASGRGDGYVEEAIHHWDRAAALLIATESGADYRLLRSPSGNDLVVCAAADRIEEFLALTRECGFVASSS